MKFDAQWFNRMRRTVAASKDSKIFITPLPAMKIMSNKRAAVFVALCNRHGQASVLFTVRSQKVGTHKGQVSFPGGHMDDGETEIDAAFRETYEELGDDIGTLHAIGLCQTLPAKTGIPVTPVLGIMERDVANFEHFAPSADEVDRVFTRSLSQLMDPEYKSYEMLGGRSGDSEKTKIRFPVYGGGEGVSKDSNEYEERIWGFTAFVLEAVLKQIIVPTKPP